MRLLTNANLEVYFFLDFCPFGGFGFQRFNTELAQPRGACHVSARGWRPVDPAEFETTWARSTFLPMRRKPEIATFTVIFIASLERSSYVFAQCLNKSAAINWTRGHGVNAASPGVLNDARKQ